MQMQENEILEQIKKAYENILGNNLVGIYVHGSIAFGCFNWDKSDIDFLVVTKEQPSLDEKEELIEVLLRLDNISPPKGLEMSLILEKYCKEFVYPTPFELHFSNIHKHKCQSNVKDYCLAMKGVDKDLAAHFTVVHHVGITLCGIDIKSLFGTVPKEYYIDSIKYDIQNAINEIDKNPVYIVLNLCRVLAFIKDGFILSKELGGQWGMKNLPEAYRSIIQRVERSYCSNEAFEMDMENDTLTQFAEYMIMMIFERYEL